MPDFLDGDGVTGDPGRYLLRIRDLGGRLHGLGFVVDPQGTVLTAYEGVAGLDRIVLHTPGGQTRVLGPDSVLALPQHGLALLRTDAVGGLPVPPLPIAVAGPGHQVALAGLSGEGERAVALRAAVLGTTTVVHAPRGERGHPVDGVLLLDLSAVGAAAAVPAGAPVLDARSGAVVGVVAPSLAGPQTGGPQTGGALTDGALTAVPAAGGGPGEMAPELAEALARNAAGVPGYGPALNLAGVLRLAAVQLAAAGAGPGRVAALAADRVDRPDGPPAEEPPQPLTALVGAPGSGRTTELAALAVRRTAGVRPLPTLWLRGADLRPEDRSLADAVGRALAPAALELGTPPPPPPTEVAALCAAAGRPLLVVLDAPEEAPAPLGAAWLRATAQWLAACGARLLTACGEEAWERLAEEGCDRTAPDGPAAAAVHRLGPLPAEAAERVRRRYGVPPGWTAEADARHPLALRLAGELCAEGLTGEAVRRGELFAAHLDLRCLRVAQRIAADGQQPRRPGAHRRGATRPAGRGPGRARRLAAAVAGRVHEAARRMLGAGQGGLDRAAFEELFPTAGGWATAVLAEGLFVPAGPGYRLAHGELSDWLQGLHLDLDAALRLLLGEAEDTRPAGEARGVPRHRIGPVAAALQRLAETWGAPALDLWLHRLWRALDLRPPGSEPAWWAGGLLAAGLAASPDVGEHRALLAQLAGRIAERAATTGGFEQLPAAGLGRFGPAFWTGLGLPAGPELALLRRLVAADGPGQPFLTAVADRLRTDPAAVIPQLCTWFDDPHGLPARPGTTVADLAHDLLYAHRRLALDDLTEALADAAHPRADALLTLLAAEEPSALCRAVDRWSHDPRPERHVAAAVHALRTAPHASGAGRELLRYTAQTLLAREAEPGLHGAALALLLQDGPAGAAHLPAALAVYRRGEDPFLTARALAPALESDPEAVLAALADRLPEPGAAVAEALRVLADARAPIAARRGAELAGRLLRECPGLAGPIAVDYLGRRLARGGAEGPAARLELRLLLGGALAARAPAVRRPFAQVLATPVPGTAADALRRDLLDTLLATEGDPAVLTAALERLAEGCAADGPPERIRALVARAAAGLPAADEVLVRCADRWPAFALLLARWPGQAAPPPPAGPRLDRLRALAAAGHDPRYAAAEAGREPSPGPVPGPARPAGHPAVRPTRLPVPKQGQTHGTL
ncbi:trypsin-like peptidase domain-containing protein [Kitasatospora sp. NPDC058170]|uniref:trypsin-like peptidase domain-containing protein n=1 Tax=Kitasatospora sp. NPDC058170 TaxID=3346364 RepID=UPI0036DABD58